MRQLPDDFDSDVKAALDAARAFVELGDLNGARVQYEAAWDVSVAKRDHYHACVVAHMAGVIEVDAAKKHHWNLDALREAAGVNDRERVKDFYASLYGNLAFSFATLGDLDEALRYQERAMACLDDIAPGPYRDRVVAGATAQLARITAQLAEQGARSQELGRIR
jgi:tetratricopeptide (TPR) repeat protein